MLDFIEKRTFVSQHMILAALSTRPLVYVTTRNDTLNTSQHTNQNIHVMIRFTIEMKRLLVLNLVIIKKDMNT